MNITRFIQGHKELRELPFLIVWRTMQILKEMDLLRDLNAKTDVEETQ